MSIITAVSNTVLNIDADDVINEARNHQLDVQTVQDFRKQRYHYDRIEDVMEDYRTSFSRISALGGLTSGVGGFFTSLTIAGIDTISLSIQLYRLAQRFAILNGFDGNDPLHKDKMMNIYFESLGLNAVLQAALKHQFLEAGAAADSDEVSDNLMLKLIIRAGRLLGKNLTSEEAGRFVPVVGGLIGATVDYSFARKTSGSMKQAFKRAYFKTWQGEEL